MPKLILRCNYLKNAPPSHLANYMNYISTREGVEKVDNTCGLLPATVKQKEMIADILSKIEDADRMHEYYDYLQRPTRENATEFITQALENNLDIIAKKKNYIDYLANRPRVEKIGTHGLFSNEGESIVLSRVAEEVANHPGVIWTNVISLRREDAERLGYDSAAQWQALLRSRVELLCENYKIDSRNLKWYAAFHNESHHPYVHLVVYSTNPSEGYLSPKGSYFCCNRIRGTHTEKGDEDGMQPVVILLVSGVIMFSVIGGLSLLAHYYTLNGIKSKTVGDGQHGAARFATKKEIEETYVEVAYEPEKWRKGENLPTAQGLVLGSIERVGKLYALVDTGDVHCLMIGAAGVGKTAHFLYPNIEYACACGMSFLTTDTNRTW